MFGHYFDFYLFGRFTDGDDDVTLSEVTENQKAKGGDDRITVIDNGYLLKDFWRSGQRYYGWRRRERSFLWRR